MTYQPSDPNPQYPHGYSGQQPPPGYPPPPYGYPQWHPGQQPPPYGYPYRQGTNGMAIASMVLGIVWVYWIGSVLALIFGLIARKQIRERNEGGDGMAIAGIVLGIVGLVILAALIVIGVAVDSGT